MVKFLHTADWQLGRAPLFLSEDARPRFRGARLDVIDAIGRLARDQGCRFVVVSGDVFESNLIARQVLVRALDKMRANPHVHFYLLPGNHDPLDASSIFRCRTFIDSCPDNVTVLDEAGPVEATSGVELIAAPWHTKRPLSDLVDDACGNLEPSDAVRIVVGHGAVNKLSPSTSNPALISLERIEERIGSGLIHYVALGDRHSTTKLSSTGRVWYSGAPEPTDDDEDDPGNVLLVSLDRDGVQVEARRVGTWRFERTGWELGTDAANDIVASVGSRGDSYDNALAETTIGLYKAELVRHRGPWRGLDDLELATLEWVHWFNNRRIHHHNPGRVPPAEAEDLHYRQQHSARHSETQTKQPA